MRIPTILKSAIVAGLCALMLVTNADAQNVSRRVTQSRTGKPARRPRPRKPLPPNPPQQIVSVKPEFNRKEILSGTVISVDAADRFMLRDERGLDTIVLLFQDTLYRIETSPGTVAKGDPSVIKPGAKVTVEGLLNADYQMKAVVIKTRATFIRSPEALLSRPAQFRLEGLNLTWVMAGAFKAPLTKTL
jgi:hypothetical protein